MDSESEAATIILDAVLDDEWRILVGDDAWMLDEAVRSDPLAVYGPTGCRFAASGRGERWRARVVRTSPSETSQRARRDRSAVRRAAVLGGATERATRVTAGRGQIGAHSVRALPVEVGLSRTPTARGFESVGVRVGIGRRVWLAAERSRTR